MKNNSQWSLSQVIYITFWKRLFDFLIALVALPFVLIVIAVIAPFIWLEDKGPVFYNAKRIGRNGKLFPMMKFRSMKVDAPDIRLADGSTYNGEDDPRVTRMGKFLRNTSLDEVPQLLNVLMGQMSLIGPRPDPPDWLARYPKDIRFFLKVRPGITGYNQAFFRNSADAEEKMKNDLFYAQKCSFFLDIRILWQTVMTVLGRKNLYVDRQ